MNILDDHDKYIVKLFECNLVQRPGGQGMVWLRPLTQELVSGR